MNFLDILDTAFAHTYAKLSIANIKKIEISDAGKTVEADEVKTNTKRIDAIDIKRRETPCRFDCGISFEEFKCIVETEASRIKRIAQIKVYGPEVNGIVYSQSGLSTWEFQIDFNDWGKITGYFWTESSITNSHVNEILGERISEVIRKYLEKKNIRMIYLAEQVYKNIDLINGRSLNSYYKEKIWEKYSKVPLKQISVDYAADYYQRMHLYPVISMLKNDGFVNIHTISINDVDDKCEKYIYEVESITIDGSDKFKPNDSFNYNTKIVIKYHQKKKVKAPFSAKDIKGLNYQEIADCLLAEGFINVKAIPLNDLITGWVLQNGTVADVTVTNRKYPLMEKHLYQYDAIIEITYHSFK